jgi:hypothetical protein
MEISIRYVKLSLSKCESDRACRSLPTSDILPGRALRFGPITEDDVLLKLFSVQQAREEQSKINLHKFL